MFDISALDLARMQFAFTVSFHIIFPAFSIGLASYLAVLEGLWLWKKEDRYMEVFNYWKTIFAVGFGRCDGVPVRHKLVRFFGQSGAGNRPVDGV